MAIIYPLSVEGSCPFIITTLERMLYCAVLHELCEGAPPASLLAGSFLHGLLSAHCGLYD